jgi:hypothetical protein
MHRVEAPALRGNDALGFLAAVGVVALSEQGCIAPVRLAWEGGTAPQAVFVSGGYATANELAGDLRKVAEQLAASGQAIPGVPADFPYRQRHPADTATGADPMRMSRPAAVATYREAAEAWARGEPWFARWLVALLAMDALDSSERVRLTPFNAPFGQMKFRDSYFDQATACLLDAKKLPGAPLDAFTGWQRLQGYTGANLDYRGIRDAVVGTDGKPSNAAAPSPTWLALMGIRMFPMAESREDVRAAGWQSVRVDADGTRRSLVWPVWREPLDAPAIRALINHPALLLQAGRRGRLVPAGARALAGLGVTAVFGASRRTRTQGDGPIGPARRLWPA